MKRLIAAIAAAVLGISAQAGWKEGVNTDADGVRWNFRYDEEERVAYIQGAQYYGRTLRIPAKVSLGEVEYHVVLIEASAFSRFKDSLAATINNIVIPSSVAIIEQNAFEGCSSLTSLVIGSGVDEIDEEAFKDCFSLKEVTIPKNVTSLRARAFMGCTSLQDVNFDRKVGGTAGRFTRTDFYSIFANTPYLATANANDNFANAIDLGSAVSGKTSADNSIATLEDGEPDTAYSRSLWWKWTAPAGVTDVAFYSHQSGLLHEINVYTGTALGELEEVGETSYWRTGSQAIVGVSVEPGQTYYILVGDRHKNGRSICGRFELCWQAANGFAFLIEEGRLFGCVGRNCPLDLVIPNNVVVIDERAFSSEYYFGSENVRFVTIPESVGYIDVCAFYGCANMLTPLTIANCGLLGIEDAAFFGCESLGSADDIILPDTVRYVRDGDVFGGYGGDLTVHAPEAVQDMFKSGDWGAGFGNDTHLEVKYFRVPTEDYTTVLLNANLDDAWFVDGLWTVSFIAEDCGEPPHTYVDDDSFECTKITPKRGETAWRDAISRLPTDYSEQHYRFDGFWTARTGGTQVWDHNMKYVGGTAYWTSDGKWKYSGKELVVYGHWIDSSSQSLTIGGGKEAMSRAYSCEAKTAESFSVACNSSWTATASASWITIASGASGSGNGTVKYKLAENTGTSMRSGTIKVKCGSITRTCTITQDKPLLIGGKTSMSRTYEKTAQTDCYFSVTCSQSSWTAASTASWVTLQSGSSSGVGSGKIYYNVAANSGPQRTAKITVTSRGLSRVCTITQKAGGEATLTIGGGKTSMSRGYSCEAKTAESFSVACNGSWTATPSASWITIISGASGSGNGTVKYKLAENTGTSMRSGTIKVKCGSITRTCTITQDKPLLIGGKTSMSRTYAAAKQTGCYFTVTCSQTSWTAVSSASWVTLKTSGGTGTGTLTYDIAANTSSSSRTATIKVTSRGLTRTCTIKQNGK